MTMTPRERDLHRAYSNLESLEREPNDLSERIRCATNEAFQAVESALFDNDLKSSGMDGAMSLELAIFNLICVSNKIDPMSFAPAETD